MRLFRYLPSFVAILLVAVAVSLLLPSSRAFAQAACPIQAPTTVTATTYTFAASDTCKVLIFSAGGAVTITLPNPATTLPPGFVVSVKSIGAGGVTVSTPSTGNMDGVSSPIAVSQGKGVTIWADGTNYFSSGIGVAHP